MPDLPAMLPPVGKSGPGRISIISSMVTDGLSINAQTASITSPKLCGGMLVAIPTAIPVDPFINKVGRAEGNTEGSVELSL
jgi:hypothetical protein